MEAVVKNTMDIVNIILKLIGMLTGGPNEADGKNTKKRMWFYLLGIILGFALIMLLAYLYMPKDDTTASVNYAEESNQQNNDLEEIVEEEALVEDVLQEEALDEEALVEDVLQEEALDEEALQEDLDDATEVKQYYFRNDSLLTQHYEKHGIDMGFDSKESYEAAASMVVTNPDSLHKTEADDGDDVYYLEETNEFVIVSTDGYIRTYFLPDGGKKYFDKQ